MAIGVGVGEVLTGIMCSLDEHLEAAARVRWTMRVLSVREVRQVRDLVRQAGAEGVTAEQENDRLNAALLLGITGWENAPEGVAFGAEGLDAALSTQQKYDLARQYPSLLYVAEWEKKASRLRLASAAAPSAQDAPAGSATTNPTTPTV